MCSNNNAKHMTVTMMVAALVAKTDIFFSFVRFFCIMFLFFCSVPGAMYIQQLLIVRGMSPCYVVSVATPYALTVCDCVSLSYSILWSTSYY